jgi:hypothetical protein
MAIITDITTYAGAFMPQQYCKITKVEVTKDLIVVTLGIHMNQELSSGLHYEEFVREYQINLLDLDTVNPISFGYEKLKTDFTEAIDV